MKTVLVYRKGGKLRKRVMDSSKVVLCVSKDSKGKRWLKSRYEVVKIIPIGALRMGDVFPQ